MLVHIYEDSGVDMSALDALLDLTETHRALMRAGGNGNDRIKAGWVAKGIDVISVLSKLAEAIAAKVERGIHNYDGVTITVTPSQARSFAAYLEYLVLERINDPMYRVTDGQLVFASTCEVIWSIIADVPWQEATWRKPDEVPGINKAMPWDEYCGLMDCYSVWDENSGIIGWLEDGPVKASVQLKDPDRLEVR